MWFNCRCATAVLNEISCLYKAYRQIAIQANEKRSKNKIHYRKTKTPAVKFKIYANQNRTKNDDSLNIVCTAVCVLLLRTTVVRVAQRRLSARQHLALWTEVPLEPTPRLHHFISVTHETGGCKMEATSPHSQNHLGPWMSSYLLPQPPSGARSDVKVLSPLFWKWDIAFPRRM